ncbi:hypothetical protein D1872_318950 [compost metagenome]
MELDVIVQADDLDLDLGPFDPSQDLDAFELRLIFTIGYAECIFQFPTDKVELGVLVTAEVILGVLEGIQQFNDVMLHGVSS